MGRSPCCLKTALNRGSWTASEDKILTDYITFMVKENGDSFPSKQRCGKSCRLRWLNYLKPDIKRGNISSDEEDLIIRLHKLLGNRWLLIARRLPGRIDNEIKNYWNTTLTKKVHQLHHHHNNHNSHIDSDEEHRLIKQRQDKECVVNETNEPSDVAVRCSRPPFSPHPPPTTSNVVDMNDPYRPTETVAAIFPSFYHDGDMTNPSSSFNLDVNVGGGSCNFSGLFNMEFMDSFNLNDDHMVKGGDHMVSAGSSTICNHTNMVQRRFWISLLQFLKLEENGYLHYEALIHQ